MTNASATYTLVNLTKREVKVAKVVNIYEAKTNLSELVELAAQGEEVIIAKAGIPKVRLVPIAGSKGVREPGGWEGKVWVAPDFDEPLSDEELLDWEFGEEE